MFNTKQFTDLIEDTLTRMGLLTSPAVTDLLLGTAAQESGFGTYLRQMGGPALGVFQMEPATEKDIWINYLRHREDLCSKIIVTTGVASPDEMQLAGNLLYQIAMCRIHYRRVREPLPEAGDIPGLARYWKQHYNTPTGRGTEAEFIANYRRYVSRRH